MRMTKILLIEDDPLIFRLYQKLFSLESYETELAEDGQAGLDALKHFQPDIILLDIMMPNMNGIEMLTHLKTNDETKNIPVVVLTNVADMNVTNIALSKGAVVVIIKSQSEPADVIATIKGVLAKYPQDTNSEETKPKSDEPKQS